MTYPSSLHLHQGVDPVVHNPVPTFPTCPYSKTAWPQVFWHTQDYRWGPNPCHNTWPNWNPPWVPEKGTLPCTQPETTFLPGCIFVQEHILCSSFPQCYPPRETAWPQGVLTQPGSVVHRSGSADALPYPKKAGPQKAKITSLIKEAGFNQRQQRQLTPEIIRRQEASRNQRYLAASEPSSHTTASPGYHNIPENQDFNLNSHLM